MNIEEKIFKKACLNKDALLPYGFIKSADKYVYSKLILNQTFRVDIIINDKEEISSKIIDLDLNEEYNNHQIESITGEFVNKVRDEFEKVLINIRENCFSERYFISDQANRITNFIYKKYGSEPEFLWEKSANDGVFRNANNNKWYGLIMHINKSKIDDGNDEVDIINVKLDKDEINRLLSKKGFYKAYHMNKLNWITIILDDTLSDNEIMNYVIKSHMLSEKAKEWIIPANPKYYDMIDCFNDTNTMTWKYSNNIEIKDIVYLYIAKPYSAILYKCEVIEVNIPYEYKDENLTMSKVMKIKLFEKYDKEQYTIDLLHHYGVKAIRGPRGVPEALSKYIHMQEKKKRVTK